MSERWYRHWIDKATEAEAAGQLVAAIGFVTRAQAHLGDAGGHLGQWKSRLLRECNAESQGTEKGSNASR